MFPIEKVDGTPVVPRVRAVVRTKKQDSSIREERERVTARVPQDVYAKLNQAAALSGTTVNSYIVQAALASAQELIDATNMRTIKLVNEADLAWFLNKIEEPFTPNDKLKKALHRYSEFVNESSGKDV